MAIIVNNLQISGTSSANNYIQGSWIQNDSVTAMNFSYLTIENSTVSGGAPPSWYAPIANGNINIGGNTGWDFAVPGTPEYYRNFLFFFVT